MPKEEDALLTGTPPLLKRRHKCCLVAAVIVAAAGIILAVCCEIFIRDIIRTQLPMKDTDSMLFQVWQDSNNKGLPLLRNFYVWNLTNPWEVYNRVEIPNFVKIGPYVYREHMYAPMENIEWSPDRTQLSFNYISDFTWDPELSVDPVFGQLHENDTFTTINLALWSAVYRVAQFPDIPVLGPLMKSVSCATMDGVHNGTIVGANGYFIQPKVSEYMFGYRDEVWWAIQNESAVFLPSYEVPSFFRSVFNGSQPAPSPYSYASGLTCPVWDNQSVCNSSSQSRNVIYTGVGDVSRVAQYVEWAGQDAFWWWNNDADAHAGPEPLDANQSCHTIRGSNAMNYPPGLTREDAPYVYVDNIFRSVKLQYTQDATVKDVPTLQFGIANEEKDVNSPNSRCYHTRYPAVFNLTAPYFAPMLVSQPYFWGVPDAEHVLVDEPDLPSGQGGATILNFTINGTHVTDLIAAMDPSEAELILRIEPNTGTLMQAHGRIQLGSWLRPLTGCAGNFDDLQPQSSTNATSNITSTSYFPYTMMPILYLDRTVTAPDALAHTLYLYVVLSVLLSRIIGSVLAVLAVMGALVMIWRQHSLRRHALTSQQSNVVGQSSSTVYGGSANVASKPLLNDRGGEGPSAAAVNRGD